MVAEHLPDPYDFPTEPVPAGRARSRLRDLVARSGYSREWWAKMTGIRPHRMALILTGRDYPTPWELWLAEKIFFDPDGAAVLAALPMPTAPQIEELRERLGDSPEAFAARLALSPRLYRYWLSGERHPKPTRQRILHWLRRILLA